MVKVSQEDFNAAMDRVKKFYKALLEEVSPAIAYRFLEGMCVGLVSLYAGADASDKSVLLMAEITATLVKVDAE